VPVLFIRLFKGPILQAKNSALPLKIGLLSTPKEQLNIPINPL